MSKKTQNEITYDLLRREFDNQIALDIWRLVSTIDISAENSKYLLEALRSLHDDRQRYDLIDSVWKRHFQLVAEKILP